MIIEEEYGLTVYAKPAQLPRRPLRDACRGEHPDPVRRRSGPSGGRDGGRQRRVLVVPSWMAEAVLEWALEHENAENYAKEKIRAEGVTPGKYYPPTAELLAEMSACRDASVPSLKCLTSRCRECHR